MSMGATIKKDDGWEYADVEFRAKPSGSNYCICDACHQVGEVLKLTLPETYYQNGEDLITTHRAYWLCSVCEEKLMSALTPLELEEV